MSNYQKTLHNIYYDPVLPAGFRTVEKIYNTLKHKISKKKISDWLLAQETYTRHKPRYIHFKRQHYLIDNIDDLWESDLIVLNDELMRQNNENYAYIVGKLKFILNKIPF